MTDFSRLSCAALVLAGAALCACGASLPKPPTGPMPPDAMMEVPYPPPAARVETIPERPEAGDVWIDGQWDWDGGGWRWLAGTWMKPPPDAYFTRWTTERRADGRLYFGRAAWRDKTGRPLDIGWGRETCPVPRQTAAIP